MTYTKKTFLLTHPGILHQLTLLTELESGRLSLQVAHFDAEIVLRIPIGPTLGIEVPMLMAGAPSDDLDPLAEKAGQPNDGQVEPTPTHAVDGVAELMHEKLTGMETHMTVEIAYHTLWQPDIDKGAQRHAHRHPARAFLCNGKGYAPYEFHPVNLSDDDAPL